MKTMINKFVRRALLTLCMVPGLLSAQKAGDVISGVISDSQGPLMMVNVIEVDDVNRINASAITDINGEFSFRLVDPKDKIRVSFVGYTTVELPFTKTYFEIELQDMQEIEQVDIVAERFVNQGGMAIPITEQSASIATIDMKEFEGLGLTSVDEALQGRIPGLDITFNSGDLGVGSTIRLRGVSTITGNVNPLIVVDGNIWAGDQNAKNNFDFGSANEENYAQLLSINPEDIQSISVLKDAAATAMWGAEGGNGVIEITTKRGSKGNTRLSYNFRLNGTWQPEGYKLLNGDQYTMFLKEAYFNPRLSDAASDFDELNYDKSFSEYQMYNNNTDWPAQVKTFGIQQSHDIAISGGGDKANFRISAGYAGQNGSIIGQHLDRFTTRVALDYFISDRIKVVTNFNMTYTINKQNAGDLLADALKRMPNLAVYYEDAEGNPTDMYYEVLASAPQDIPKQANPVAVAYDAKKYSKNLDMQPEFQLVYNILSIDGSSHRLTYDGRITFGVSNGTSDSYSPSSLASDGWTSSNANKVGTSASKNSSITTTHQLTFTPKFKNEKHSFMTMVRGQLGESNSKNQNSSMHGLPSGSFQSTALPGNIDDMSTGAGKSRTVNGTFSAHYAYRGKYVLDFTVRADGNTKFGDDKRWGVFPSVSGRWNIMDEDFLSDVEWISTLSLSPSWGITGRAPGSDDLQFSKYGSGDPYLGTSSMTPKNIKLSSVQWEQSQQWNLGINIGLFNNKFDARVDLYTKTTTKLLLSNQAIPSSSGYSTLNYMNCGEMHNAGWELSFDTRGLIRAGNFQIDTNISFADNINELTEMDPTILANMNKEFDFNNGSYLTYVQLKNAFGSIYGFKYKGVYQYSDYTGPEDVPYDEFGNPLPGWNVDGECYGVSGPNAPVVRDADGNVIRNQKGRTKPMMYDYGEGNHKNYEFVGGDAIYEDINHDGNINELDIVYLGSSLPKFNGGFGLRFIYKRFSANFQFNFRAGNKIINAARMNLESMYNNDNASAAVNWRWRVEGDKTEIPRALHNTGYNYLASDRFVENGSFLRLNYMQFSYNFDAKRIKAIGLSSLRLDLNMNNVFCLTKYSGADPEVGGNAPGAIATDNSKTPRSKSFQFSLSASF